MSMKYKKDNTNKKEELDSIIKNLEEGIKELMNSEKYKEYLSIMGKFHSYSLNNTMLILMQRPDASFVAGYNAWKKFDRNVQNGQKAIKILAPMMLKRKELIAAKDINGNPLLDVNGKQLKEEVTIEYPAFKIANVFDVSQTEGKELPRIGPSELSGNVDKYKLLYDALIAVAPVPIETIRIESGAKGYYSPSEQKICINEGMSEAQTLKTMVHEISHSILHDPKQKNEDDTKSLATKRSTKEVEAESVAYAVCNHFGLDTKDYSFAYIASWSQDKELTELKQSLNTIRTTTDMLINKIEDRIADRHMDVSKDKIYSIISENLKEKLAEKPPLQSFSKQLSEAKMLLSNKKYIPKANTKRKDGLEV